jgi:hypothetical protein
MRTILAAVLSVLAFAAAALSLGSGTARAAVPTYTGCLSPILNAIYDVAPGDTPAHPPCLRPASAIRLSSGDLTSLAAGTGLAGGGDNGDVSMSIAPSYRLPQTCANGESAGWNGTGWTCVSFASQADFNSLLALLGSAGTINDSSNPVHWSKLKGVPAGFADGTDDAGPAYAAGFGLNLAGATFSVDPTQVQRRIADSCATGSSIRAVAQDGTVTCQPDTGGTPYSAGAGLNLNGTEFSLADGGVTSAKLADGAVTSAKIFDSTVALADLAFDPATQAELDVLGTQGTINDSGNPVHWTRLKGVPAGLADGVDNVTTRGSPTANQITAIDTASPTVGWDTSTTIGVDGLGLISYSDAYNGWLKVAHCSNMECWSATTSILPDIVSGLGAGTSIAIGADGLGLVSYLGGPSYDLKVAHCENVECSFARTSLVDTPGQVGYQSSIAIGADGLGLISYYDATNGDLKVAHCSNIECSSATKTTLVTAGSGFIGQYTSITLGADGLGLISYQDATNGELEVAHCSNVTCSTATISTLDTAIFVGQYTSITIGADGLGLISYYNLAHDDLRVTHCSDVLCSAGTHSVLDGPGIVGQYTSITVGPDGLGLISYYDIGNADLKVAHCANAECSTASTATVDSGGDVGSRGSITSGDDGLGLVAYYDATNGDLEVAHLSNQFGVPYFHRR